MPVAIAFRAFQAYISASVFNRGPAMITVLVALRDFFVAILIGWLGLASESAETQQQGESVQPGTATIAMIR